MSVSETYSVLPTECSREMSNENWDSGFFLQFLAARMGGVSVKEVKGRGREMEGRG